MHVNTVDVAASGGDGSRPQAIILISIVAVSVCGALYLGHRMNEQESIDPAEVLWQLKEANREDAVELRKTKLDVTDLPYPSLSSESPQLIQNDSRDGRLLTEFRDEASGLSIAAKTHLCLPGEDPYVSGGKISVSNGQIEWDISFQLLGSSCPAAFQSHLPKSRKFLRQLRELMGDMDDEGYSQQAYYATLRAAIDAREGSSEQQASILQLLRLLLASYFHSAGYAATSSFAEQHQLLQ